MKIISFFLITLFIFGCVHKPYIPSGRYFASNNEISMIFTDETCTIIFIGATEESTFPCDIRHVSLGSDDFFIEINGTSKLSGGIGYNGQAKEVVLWMQGKEYRLKYRNKNI